MKGDDMAQAALRRRRATLGKLIEKLRSRIVEHEAEIARCLTVEATLGSAPGSEMGVVDTLVVGQ